MDKRLLHTFAHSHTLPDGTNEVRTAKVYRDSEWEEYVVTLDLGGVRIPSASYHTTDKQDAIGTAQLICTRT